MFELQDSLSHKRSEDSVTMVEGEEHQNAEEKMSTQELLNTIVASQIQLREDMNLMVQQLQNLKSSQEGDKTDRTSPISESEKKINEKMSKMEEMIKRAHRMDDLMD